MKVKGFILCKYDSFKPLILARVSVRTGFIAIIIDDTTQCYRSFLLGKEAKTLLKKISNHSATEKKGKREVVRVIMKRTKRERLTTILYL